MSQTLFIHFQNPQASPGPRAEVMPPTELLGRDASMVAIAPTADHLCGMPGVVGQILVAAPPIEHGMQVNKAALAGAELNE
jgi:hypothetical protein